MKKFAVLSILLLSAIAFVPTVEAKSSNAVSAASAALEPQWRRQNDRRIRQIRNNRGRVQVVTQTRIIRVGRQRYRETIQIRYLPNGRTQTRVISRTRIGRY